MSSDSAICTDGAGYIYALRGNNQVAFWRYNVGSNQWAAMQPAPQRTGSGNALVYDPHAKQIYALRGNNQYDFWHYDIATNRWFTTLSSTPARVNSGGSLALASQDDLYAFRGGTTTAFWHYSISQNLWTTATATPMSGVRTGGSLTTGPSAYISNGEIDSLVLNTTQQNCKIREVFWNITTPTDTAIDVQIRASDSLAGGVPNSTWVDLQQTSPAVTELPSGQYIQWRVLLTSNDVNETPVLSEVRVYYT